MERLHTLSLLLVALFFFHGDGGAVLTNAAGTQDGSQQWGYVKVRPNEVFVVVHDSLMAFAADEASFVSNAEAYCFHSISAFALLYFKWEALGEPAYEEAHVFWWLYRSPHRVEDPSNPWPIVLWLQGGPDNPVGTGYSFV